MLRSSLLFFAILLGSYSWAPGLGQISLWGQESRIPPGRASYMGRRIAVPMSHLGADWLIRAERDAEEDPQRMLEQLQVKPGMVVCDMGCGNGFYSLP
ncbi:MAG: hypothetical protein ACK53L_29935, partial [Pirellulaceae bacterium]